MILSQEIIKREIQKGLPGKQAQWQMSSRAMTRENISRMPGPDATEAAVLIALYPRSGSVFTVFIQRPDYNGFHSGQISFPGGRKEPADNDSTATALREACEEVGIDPKKISVAGTLTPLFIPVSNMVVTPVAGWTDTKPAFVRQPGEVEYIIEAELKRFLDPSIVKTRSMEVRGEIRVIKYFDYDGHVIWGATAMILNELLEIIRRGNLI